MIRRPLSSWATFSTLPPYASQMSPHSETSFTISSGRAPAHWDASSSRAMIDQRSVTVALATRPASEAAGRSPGIVVSIPADFRAAKAAETAGPQTREGTSAAEAPSTSWNIPSASPVRNASGSPARRPASAASARKPSGLRSGAPGALLAINASPAKPPYWMPASANRADRPEKNPATRRETVSIPARASPAMRRSVRAEKPARSRM